MKKILSMVLLGGMSLLSAQGLSCVEFVQMSESEVKSEITKLQNSFPLESFSTNPSDEDKKSMKYTSMNTRQLTKCIHLRHALQYVPKDGRRYKALLELRDFSLTAEEKHVYMQSIQGSIKHFKAFSNSSLVGNHCHLPLVYLTAQNNANTLVVYEHRLQNGRVDVFKKSIGAKDVFFVCADKSGRAYYNYLRQKKNINFTLATVKTVKKERERERRGVSDTLVTTMLLFKVKNYLTDKKEDIPVGATVKVVKSVQYDNGKVDIVFLYKNQKYITNSYQWTEAIKEKRSQK